MPSEQYKLAKEKWLSAKAKHDEAVILFEGISNLVEYTQKELDQAFNEFNIEQSKQVHSLKRSHVKEVKE